MNRRTKAVRGTISIPPPCGYSCLENNSKVCTVCLLFKRLLSFSFMLSSKPNLPRGSSQVTVCFSQDASLITSYSSHCMFWCALFCTTASLLSALCFHHVCSCSSLHWAPVLQPLFALCGFIISCLRTLRVILTKPWLTDMCLLIMMLQHIRWLALCCSGKSLPSLTAAAYGIRLG